MALRHFGYNVPGFGVSMMGETPFISICDPKMMEDLFVKNAKYLDKNVVAKNIMYPLMGDSILFLESNEEW